MRKNVIISEAVAIDEGFESIKGGFVLLELFRRGLRTNIVEKSIAESDEIDRSAVIGLATSRIAEEAADGGRVDFFPVFGTVTIRNGEDLFRARLLGETFKSLFEESGVAVIGERDGAEEGGEAIRSDLVLAKHAEEITAVGIGDLEVGCSEDGETLVADKISDELILLLGSSRRGEGARESRIRFVIT